MKGNKLGPYEMIESIGSGGMGEVWKARDTRLDRIVAIKRVKEKHSERFKQEARSIAALNHANICQIHDIGNDYLVLEYVEGRPLQSPLPEKEAIGIAIQIAAALEAAHMKGVIHRDLKPANIMVTKDGSVKLLDFGLAKLYNRDQSISSLPTSDSPATVAGTILGTVAYMSPEQAQGQTVDARSDIFSFGLVLYELLSGKRAFPGNSFAEIVAALLRNNPPPLNVSRQLKKIVDKCLEKQPSGRYQTIEEVKLLLERVLEGSGENASPKEKPSIAVLPFADMSPGQDNRWFGDGLAEEIINALTQITNLKIPARTSSFFFRDRNADIQEIASTLNVDYILDGSVRKSGNHIRVTVQLISATDGYHQWSKKFDREMTDVFAIQDEICQAIVDQLRIDLVHDQPLIRQRTADVEAYNYCLKGRYHFIKLTPENLAKSKDYYERAIAIDPYYAIAWCRLARYYNMMGYLGFMPSKKAHELAFSAAMKAMELDELLPEAHAVAAVIKARDFNWIESERLFCRALELEPNSPDNWNSYSFFYLVPAGRLDEAVTASRKALELDPLSSFLQAELGHRLYLMKQYEEAIGSCRAAIELDPGEFTTYLFLGLSLLCLGRFDEAIDSCRRSVQLSERSPFTLAYLGLACAKANRIGEANKILAELLELADNRYVLPSCLGIMYLALGEMETGFRWFEKAVEEREGHILHLNTDPNSEPFRSHPYYKNLIRKMNMEP